MAKETITNPQLVLGQYNKFLHKQYGGNVPDNSMLTLHNLGKFAAKCQDITLKSLETRRTPPIKGLSTRLNAVSHQGFKADEIEWLQTEWLEPFLNSPACAELPHDQINLNTLFCTRYTRGEPITNPNHVAALYENWPNVTETIHSLVTFVAKTIGKTINKGRIAGKSLEEEKPSLKGLTALINPNTHRVTLNKEQAQDLYNLLEEKLALDSFSAIKNSPSSQDIMELIYTKLGPKVDPFFTIQAGKTPVQIATSRTH